MKKILIALAIALLPATAYAENVFQTDIFYGSRNKIEVIKLQEFLTDQELYNGPITGNYFSLTRSSVAKFQKKYKLRATGGFNKPTRSMANYILRQQTVSEEESPVTQPTQQPTWPTQPAPPTYPSISALFRESFNGAFPGNNWVYTKSGGMPSSETQPSLDNYIGNPAPSLSIPFAGYYATTRGAGAPGTLTVQTVTNPFNSSNGISVSADIRQPATIGGSWIKNFVFTVQDQNNPDIMARATIRPQDQIVRYDIIVNRRYIAGVDGPYFPDTNFHTFKFTIDSSGNAKWYRDGVIKASAGGFQSGDFILKFASSGYSKPSFDENTYNYAHNLDNVIVTSP